MWKALFERRGGKGLSLQEQICQMLVAAVLDGQVSSDVPLPSSRRMAQRLGVSRNTVIIAYQRLVDHGYLLARERRGYFVNPDMRPVPARGDSPVPPPGEPDNAPDWAGRFRFRPSDQRNIEKPADWQDFPYPFLYGQFDAELFPAAEWRECCLRTLSAMEIGEWAQDMILRDDASLIAQIRQRLLPRRGVWAGEDEIIITVGAQQALYLLADLLVGRDTAVGIEDPGYPDARNIFGARSERLVALPVDGEGLMVTPALAACDYVYTTPSHQCPTTVTMSMARRTALLEQAAAADVILIEDDYESQVSFRGDPFPTLKSMDRSARVIYVGSLSKSLAPGVRLGYVVGPRELIAELRHARRLNLRHPTAFLQRAFGLFLSLGYHDALLARLAEVRHRRARALVDALGRYLPQIHCVPVSGGSSAWLQGPPALDVQRLHRDCKDLGVLIEPGGIFFRDPADGQHCFRLGFSAIKTQRIEAGIQLIRDAVSRQHL
ncbi:MAG: PLP-dependent aminotransferase family protein [Castellaniella sp.]